MFAAVAGGKEGGSRLVLHRGILHAWHLFDSTRFAGTIVNWAEGKDLSSGFEDSE